MADEPAGRTHWSDSLPLQISREDLDKLQKEFVEALRAQERVEGIVHMCRLDGALEQLLRTAMIDDKCVDELMDDGQALQSFSSKLRLAYALGLISESVRRDLFFLNKIRNEFAHEADATSFDEAPLRDLCRNLSTAKEETWQAEPPRELHRMAVLVNVLYLKSEATRRARTRVSRQDPPPDWPESAYRTYLDRQNKPTK